MVDTSGSFPFDKLRITMTAKEHTTAETRTTATALFLADCLHPTHRKVRDGWGTLSFVASEGGQTNAFSFTPLLGLAWVRQRRRGGRGPRRLWIRLRVEGRPPKERTKRR